MILQEEKDGGRETATVNKRNTNTDNLGGHLIEIQGAACLSAQHTFVSIILHQTQSAVNANDKLKVTMQCFLRN